jgi:hypothetical protein
MNLFDWLREPLMRWVCRRLHGAPYHPVNRQYECRRCGRLWDVPWAGPRIALSTPRAVEMTGIEKAWRELDEIQELERMVRT